MIIQVSESSGGKGRRKKIKLKHFWESRGIRKQVCNKESFVIKKKPEFQSALVKEKWIFFFLGYV